MAAIAIDLDGFKTVNDALGHPDGDRVLQVVAERLRGLVRASDSVGRVGGDEFALVLSEVVDADAAARVAQRIVEALGASIAVPGRPAAQDVRLTASAGVAVYPEDGDDSEALVRHADVALYRAKAQGGNAHRRYTAAAGDGDASPGSLPPETPIFTPHDRLES